MTQQLGQAFVVAATGNAVGGKGMAQAVELAVWNAQLSQLAVVPEAVFPRLLGLWFTSDDVAVITGLHESHKVTDPAVERDRPYRAFGLRGCDIQPAAICFCVGPDDSLPDVQHPGSQVHIRPLESAKLPDADAGVDREQDTDGFWCLAGLEIVDECNHFGLVKYLDLFWRLIRQPDFPNVRAGDFDDSQDVSDKRLRKASACPAVPGLQQLKSQLLHSLSGDGLQLSQMGDKVVLHDVGIAGVCAVLLISSLVSQPLSQYFFVSHFMSSKWGHFFMEV